MQSPRIYNLFLCSYEKGSTFLKIAYTPNHKAANLNETQAKYKKNARWLM